MPFSRQPTTHFVIEIQALTIWLKNDLDLDMTLTLVTILMLLVIARVWCLTVRIAHFIMVTLTLIQRP